MRYILETGTPANTVGLGNPGPIDAEDTMSEPISTQLKPKRRKKMRHLAERLQDGPIQAEPDMLGTPTKIKHNRKPKETGNKVEIE